ncbi:MAG TPA: YebC/PmpR family DNA-binding transcriptional regulator, partial [Chloroflexota bacterium]|nr:YebC/PmpR family DNA-binding transcriptional regulator [Chloroflexota bacterium]
REITIAAREGGADPDANFRLRLAVQHARDANMPSENIDRAIKRGSGQLEGPNLEDVTYEGYGPGGAAVLVEGLTDNRNRAFAEIRNAFTRGGGNLGESGCVGWLFEPRGIVTLEADGHDPDEIALQAIDAGAEDVQNDGGTLEVFTSPSEIERVRHALDALHLKINNAEATMVPKTTVSADDDTALKVMKLVERLEELDDVQKVYTNLEIPDSVWEQLEK